MTFIHEVVRDECLQNYPAPVSVEFYLCGPPMMIKTCNKTLADLGVDDSQVYYNDF